MQPVKRVMSSQGAVATSVPTPVQAAGSADSSKGADDLHSTLARVFGYSSFRSGQHEVVQAVMEGKDSVVIWSTGAGKSICYQLPALHTKRTVIVVSPLISLMQDQVNAINMKCGKVATYLGTAQRDTSIESRLAAGEFLLAYVTPEKASTDNFHGLLRKLCDKKQLLAIAIDEAHCVSEWGHDFRPSYRSLSALRVSVPGVPILALTATATPQVRADIKKALQLRTGPEALYENVGTVYRPNLSIVTKRKKTMQEDLSALATHLAATKESTIIYAATIGDVETIGRWLRERLSASGVDVGIYHASLGMGEREETHLRFLTGALHIVVATVAFGMGIDKPDIRRVVHYGAPKTFEEYYQQIGRAGRDGLQSYCVMYYNDADFNKYLGDFYMRGLSDEQRKIREQSLATLRTYAEGGPPDVKCFWRQICSFFGDGIAFDSCKACTFCENSSVDTRDFGAEARHAIRCAQAVGCVSKTQLLPVFKGALPPKGATAQMRAVAPHLLESYKALGRRGRYLEALLPLFISAGLLKRETREYTAPNSTYTVHYDAYSASDLGMALLKNSAPVKLKAPDAFLDEERKAAERLAATRKELVDGGVDLARVPKEEIDAGDGPVLKIEQHWMRLIKRLKDDEKTAQKAESLCKLLDAILKWRSKVAMENRLAPHHVMEDHVAKRIAYSQPKSLEALEQCGVRVQTSALLEVVQSHVGLPGLTASQETTTTGQSAGAEDEVLDLPVGNFVPKEKWEFAMYKLGAKGKPPAWEPAWKRFQQGEHPEAIAMSPDSGKPIQVSTVQGYILSALLHKRPVNLRRLAEVCPPPKRSEWERLDEAAEAASVDLRAEEFKMKDLLRAILGEKVDEDGKTKDEAQKQKESMWYNHMRYWRHLKIAGVEAKFAAGEPSKKLRTE